MTTYLTRITYNTCNWRHPSGSKAKKETGTFVADNGFGYEEWLFRDEWLVERIRYAFVEGVRRCNKNLFEAGEPFNLVLFTIEPGRRRRFVAVIKNVSYVDEAENLKAKEYFTKKGWCGTMLQDILHVAGNASVMYNAKLSDAPFNIKFKPKDVTIIKEPIYAKSGSKIYNLKHYLLFKRDPFDEKHRALYKPIKEYLPSAITPA